VKRITGFDWPLLALAGCLLALSAASALGVTHFDDPIVRVVLLLLCFYPFIGVIYLTCVCAYLYFGFADPVGSAPDLHFLHSHFRSRICVTTPMEGGGTSCRFSHHLR